MEDLTSQIETKEEESQSQLEQLDKKPIDDNEILQNTPTPEENEEID